MFELSFFALAIFAGALASLSGFGIGMLLTPVLATQIDIRLAVAAVTFPHLIATFVRFWGLRKELNRQVFVHFGMVSALGALVGATLHNLVNTKTIATIFGALLILVGISGLTGLMQKLNLGRKAAWITGFISGLFGGLVGNQGGIRSASLLAFRLNQKEFVATTTAAGLVVDLVRMPIYLADHGVQLMAVKYYIAIAIFGCILGTVFGAQVLHRLPAYVFRQVVACLVVTLGAYMIIGAPEKSQQAAIKPGQYIAGQGSTPH